MRNILMTVMLLIVVVILFTTIIDKDSTGTKSMIKSKGKASTPKSVRWSVPPSPLLLKGPA
ncbi:hypothetical protein N6H14_16500 [Paenibacillus sp. CC-CFT747]|nr:hypothetical protein N6H14_16500 [Paenibacillus sp. CC-CFT747]